MTLRYEKYEGLGNDFLVVADEKRELAYDEEFVRRLCDRSRGFGADGCIRLSATGGASAFRMELRNADGSFAETSGNGLRCAALAARMLGFVSPREDAFGIETAIGISHVEFVDAPQNGMATVRVDMGPMAISKASSPVPEFEAFRVDVGNPHLVLIGSDVAAIELFVVGPELEHSEPQGLNVEVIAERGTDQLDFVVWERGAGLTQACGTGSCAAAGAARMAGLVSSRVEVFNPGGMLVVELHENDDASLSAALIGPARRIGRVEPDPGLFTSIDQSESVRA